MATNTEDDAAETIVTPPDHLIARELAESPIKKKSTSSSSSKISLQESTKRIRMTPAAKRREDMAEKMLSLYEKEQQRELEEVDDEYVMSFISMAKRINSLLDKRQKERVLQEVEDVVKKYINRALDAEESRVTAVPAPPPPAVTPAPHNFNPNFGHNVPQSVPPPLVNAANLQSNMSQLQQETANFFNQGQITYDPQSGQQLYQM